MIVVMHQPPLRRIETTRKPMVIEPEVISEATKALRDLGIRIANERIWRLVPQSAEGCNAPTVTE